MAPGSSFGRSVALTTCAAAALCAAGVWDGWGRFGAEGVAFATRLRTGELSKTDATLMQRGYYENLMGAGRFNSRLFEVFMGEPRAERFDESDAARPRDDFLDLEIVPDVRTSFRGASFTTNRWGFRDRDYERGRPPETYRIAVLGASITMGWGVADGAPFADRLEERLNADAADAPFRAYEVLNLAVAGYTPPQQLMQLHRALAFEPHAVMVVSHEVEIDRGLARLVRAREAGLPIPFDSLQRAADRAWEGEASRQAAERRLRPHRYELLEWIYREMVAACRERGVVPVWVFVPTLDRVPHAREIDTLRAVAARAGMVVVDLRQVYDAANRRALRLGDADRHPTAEGHALVAAALDSALRATPSLAWNLPPARGERQR